MKANKAPEKIYVDNLNHDFFYRTKDANSIEYTRTDAFIEKVCDWLESVNLDFYQIREGVFSKQLVEDFKKYMRGE